MIACIGTRPNLQLSAISCNYWDFQIVYAVKHKYRMPVNQGETSRNDDLQRRFPKPSTPGKPVLNFTILACIYCLELKYLSNQKELNEFNYLNIAQHGGYLWNTTTVVMGRDGSWWVVSLSLFLLSGAKTKYAEPEAEQGVLFSPVFLSSPSPQSCPIGFICPQD